MSKYEQKTLKNQAVLIAFDLTEYITIRFEN